LIDDCHEGGDQFGALREDKGKGRRKKEKSLVAETAQLHRIGQTRTSFSVAMINRAKDK
jgi:hypothetical protein